MTRLPYVVTLIREGEGYWATTAYDCKRCVSESGHLILDFIDAETEQPGQLYVCRDDTLIVAPGEPVEIEVGH